MTKKITINGKNVYSRKVIDLDDNSVRIILENGDSGILYVNEISLNYINPTFLFHLDDEILVGLWKRCFDGTLLFTIKGLISKDVSNFCKQDMLYGIVIATCTKGSIIQIAPNVTGFISNVYLSKGTAVLAVYTRPILIQTAFCCNWIALFTMMLAKSSLPLNMITL